MKKALIAAAVLFVCTTSSFARLGKPEIVIKGSLQLPSALEEDGTGYVSNGYDTFSLDEREWRNLLPNFAFALESYIYNKTFAFGMGVNQQLSKKYESESDAEFSFTSVYFTAKKIITPSEEDVSLYILGQLGMSFMQHNFKYIYGRALPDIKTDPGYYVAAGMGIHFGNVIVELTGSLNWAKLSMDGTVDGVKTVAEIIERNWNFNFNIGYRFKLTHETPKIKNDTNNPLSERRTRGK
ncbi:MAG: hypothetical protein LBL00_08725 [Endomicrobium sp.]|jgi:hypothetical protein|nr:hypothetical protein [Endomicrobium sp.]